MHPEDDPMEKHDHPTSRQRLGDSAAGLGAAATLTRDRRRRDPHRRSRGVQYVSAGAVHESARVVLGDRRWFTRLHGTETDLPRIRRSWAFKPRPVLLRPRIQRRDSRWSCWAASRTERLFGRGARPDRPEVSHLEPAVPKSIGVVASTNWATAGAVGRRPVRRGVRAARRRSIGC